MTNIADLHRRLRRQIHMRPNRPSELVVSEDEMQVLLKDFHATQRFSGDPSHFDSPIQAGRFFYLGIPVTTNG